MTGSVNHIIKKLFQVNSLEEISIRQLEDLVSNYPSFNLGHYLLSLKLQKEYSPDFKEKTQKTALYFSNPFWLQWLLQQSGHDKNTSSSSDLFDATDIVPEEVDHSKPVPEAENSPEREDFVDPEQVSETENRQESEEVVAAANQDMSDQINRSVLQQVTDASKAVPEETLPFEPYHTIDYFASQGIKFVQETNPNDKLGRQLKSFTEWLRVMKKLPQKTIEQTPVDQATEANIQSDAAHSIEEKEVVTETMAEVLLKQGKSEKAVEVYRKLSLHNPDKSAYFAAKIEQLKVH